ncbi:KAT8 regulatory NSL complex subunit 2 isoform X2 [Patella vulgata]|nr:KAT8 regulatory NSL complex subunit 2 isoform X2 [Patella vulgata]
MNRKSSVRSKIKVNSEGLFCNYGNRICMKHRLEGYEFCIRHVLEDKTAPFKQCSFVPGRKGERCPNATPKGDRKDGYCMEHARRANLVRQKHLARHQPADTSESLLVELSQSSSPLVDNIKDNNKNKSRLPADSIANRILDYASSDESDVEGCLIDGTWRGDGDSDAESIDSEQEDVLKHAGVYTAEEVTLILRDKLIKLQSLYIDQFKRLQHVMKEQRRRYIHTHKQEKDSLGGLKAYKADPYLRKKYDKLKAYKRYHNRYGKEAILHRKSNVRRVAVSEGVGFKTQIYPKCQGLEDGMKCLERSVPLSKYCFKHILHDTNQVLYRPCSFAHGGCGVPVVPIDDDPRCHLHYTIIDTTNHQIQQEEELEPVDVREQTDASTDSTLSATGEFDRPEIYNMTPDHIKPELMDTS